MIALSVGKWCLATYRAIELLHNVSVFEKKKDLHELEFALDTTRVFSYLKFWYCMGSTSPQQAIEDSEHT